MSVEHDREAAGNNFVAVGNEAAITLLDKLLARPSPADAIQDIEFFLKFMGSFRSAKDRRAVAVGASVSLADVLLLGMQAVRERSRQ